LAKGEARFVETMVLPFWDALASVYPPLLRHAARTAEAVHKYATLAAT
jgi:hypothetical protein